MMARLLTIVAAFAGIQLGYAQCPALESVSGDSPVIKVDLPAKQSSAKAGSSLWVEVSMTNESDHAISFWKNTNADAQPIEVSDAAGRLLPDKRPGYRNGRFDPAAPLDPKLVDSGELVKMLSGSLVCITLKPGEKFVDRVDVTKFYDVSAPGNYTIAVEGFRPATAGAAKPSVVKPSVKVVVTK
jgi:hypothetical protein